MLVNGKSYVSLNCLLNNDKVNLTIKLKNNNVPYVRRKVNSRTPSLCFETLALRNFVLNFKDNTNFVNINMGWDDKLALVLKAIEEERKKDGLEI